MSKNQAPATPTLDFLYLDFITKLKAWSDRRPKESYGVTTLISSPEIVDRLGQLRATEWEQYVHARDIYLLAAETGQFPRIN